MYLSTTLSVVGLLQRNLVLPLHKTVCYHLESDSFGLQQHLLKSVITYEMSELETQHQRFSNDLYNLSQEEQNTQVWFFCFFTFGFSDQKAFKLFKLHIKLMFWKWPIIM